MKLSYSLVGGVLIKNFIATNDVSKNQHKENENEKRNSINEFSVKSGRRMSRFLRSCVAEYTHMVTLTYPATGNILDCKKHLRLFLARANRHLHNAWLRKPEKIRNSKPSIKPSIFWFLEFQQNGRPHFHLLINGFIHYKSVARWWFEIVGSGDNRHLLAGTRTERLRLGRAGTVSYAKKYANKTEQKELPDMFKNQGKFGRWWGVVGSREIVSASISLSSSMNGVFKYQKHSNLIDERIKSLEKQGKIKKMPYQLCECWVTNDKNAIASLTETFSDIKKELHDNQMLQQTEKVKTKDIHRERRRQDYMRGSQGW